MLQLRDFMLVRNVFVLFKIYVRDRVALLFYY